MSDLRTMDCGPTRKDSTPVTEEEKADYIAQIPDWEIVTRDGIPRLERVYVFKNFAEALAFTNKVGALAEEQDHHPALLTEWARVTVTYWTHVIKNLHANDFIMAARTDALREEEK